MNQYLETIRQAVVVYPLIMLLVTIPYVAWNYHKYGSVLSLRVLIVYSFLLYLLCVYCLVILPLPSPAEAAALHGRQMQLLPFGFVGDILKQSNIVPGCPGTWAGIFDSSAFWVTLFNLFMTLPFGVYLRYYFCCGWKKTLLLSFLLSLFCELTQLSGLYFLYPGSYRLFDVDDLIVNTAGGMLGFALAGPFGRLLPTRQELDADSFQRGASVSFPRRLFAFAADGVCLAILAVFVFAGAAAVLGRPVPVGFLALLAWVYWGLVPIPMGGQTPGKRLTRLRIVRAGGGLARPWQYPLRYGLLLLGMWALPYGLSRLLSFVSAAGLLDSLASVVLHMLLAGGWLFYLFFAAVSMSLHRPLYYERWSRTQVVSTLEEMQG